MPDILIDLLGLFGYMAVAGFISMWAHRSQSEHGRAAKMGIYLTFGFLWFILFLVGLSGVVTAWQAGEDPAGGRVLLTILGIAAGIALIPWLRRPLARIIGFDGNSYPEMVAFLFILQVPIALVGLAWLNPEPETTISVSSLIVNALAFISVAFLGVGFMINRDFKNAAKRLGLERLTPKQILIAVLCVIPALLASVLATALMQIFQPDLVEDLQDTLVSLPGDMNVLLAATLIGLTAAFGEEILMRGGIQPRFGIIFTSLVFALLHVQYGLTFAMVGVFFAGVVFGLERKYINTSAAIITHAIYNFIAVMLNASLA